MTRPGRRSAHRFVGWRQLRQEEGAQRARVLIWVRYLKIFFLIVPVLILGVVLWYLQTPPGPQVQGEEVPTQNRHQTEMATQIHLEQFEGQRTRWTLDSPVAEKQALSILVETPRLTIFREGGEKVQLTARLGAVDKTSRIMKFEGDVVAQGDGPFGRLTTEWLQFDPKRGILYTDQPFVLENRGSRLQGIELQLFQERKMVHVLRDVEMVFYDGLPTMAEE